MMRNTTLLFAVAISMGLGIVAASQIRERLSARDRPSLLAPETARDLRMRTGASVILFSDSRCPWCDRARALLREKQVVFKELYIDRSAEALALFANVEAVGVPVLVVGRQTVVGYSEPEMARALTNAAPPPLPYCFTRFSVRLCRTLAWRP